MSLWIDLIFICAALVLALFLEAIVAIFGLFASIAGFFYYFFVPFYCFIIMNKLKECNKRFDEIQEHDDMAVDNVQTAIISLATGNIQTARRLSERLFGEQQVVIEETIHGRTASTISIGNRRLSRKISINIPYDKKIMVEE